MDERKIAALRGISLQEGQNGHGCVDGGSGRLRAFAINQTGFNAVEERFGRYALGGVLNALDIASDSRGTWDADRPGSTFPESVDTLQSSR